MSLKPYIKHPRADAALQPWTVSKLCAAYQWPARLPGGGVIAIPELGGGWAHSDVDAFFRGLGQPSPIITDVSVDGSQNTPGSDADAEVALDIMVSGASYFAATGKPAVINMYWANNSSVGSIANAVKRATADGCAVCTISWGAPENEWGKVEANAMQAAALAAVKTGMTVFAASGDSDYGDGESGAHVDCPASCPSVVGCGGTSKGLTIEVVWNSGHGEGTGGGYSAYFPMPTWQDGAPHGRGRMVPDVAANADPATGYEIFLNGNSIVVGGTSAVAPLYAGLFAAFGKRLGFVSPLIWSQHMAFADITQGNNGYWRARPGPDPCTGLGAPIGNRIAKLFP